MSDANVLVEVKGLEKTFKVGFKRREVHAVAGISFDVRKGEIFGIVGPNGAGKTTTIKILTGLMTPTAGSASLFGKSTQNVTSRQRLGYLPEGPYFYEHLKTEELLIYYGQLSGLSRKEARERAKDLIPLVGLSHAANRPLKKFSKGMRQRAGLAQALINDPELIILDEPQSGLDPLGRRDVRELILGLKAQGKTVIFSSHILPDVEAVCDRVALFHNGKITAQGALQEILNQNTQSIEIVVLDLDEPTIATLPNLRKSVNRAGYIFLEYPPDIKITDTLLQLESLGGKVQSVSPKHEDLEEVFVRDTTPREGLNP